MENYLFMEKGVELCWTLCNWCISSILAVCMYAFGNTHEHIDLCYEFLS